MEEDAAGEDDNNTVPAESHDQDNDREMDEMMEEMGEEEEQSDCYTGMSAAEKKKHRVEYSQLLKDIDGQNQIVEQLKEQLFTACENPCLTKCQLREIRKLRQCIEEENLKLQCMVQKAIAMQNEVPSRCWDEVPIVTTIDDDVFPVVNNYQVMRSLGLKGDDDREGEHSHHHHHQHQNVCDKKKKKKKKKPCPCPPPCPCPDPCEEDEEEEDDDVTCKLMKSMVMKDKLIRRLTCKLKALQKEIACKKNSRKHNHQGGDESMECLKNIVDVLKEDLKCLCQEKENLECQQKPEKRKLGKNNEMEKMKDNYAQLLMCLAKKEAELKEIKGRVKGYCGAEGGGDKGKEVDKAELKLLRAKVEDMKDEQDEYKCIIQEQSEQIDEYRRKYMDSQQIVEEQKSTLAKIDLNNKRIEAQIEAEVKRIKAKFKEQLSELSQYPKLLENEQIKLATICKERDQLEDQLRLVCKELKSIREQAPKEEKSDCSAQLCKCQQELCLLQNKYEDLEKEKELILEEMLKTKMDLDTLRSESAKIITNTKERFEITKISLNSRIDRLERELAQCRANACLSITDREAVIKEMQTQLCTLSYSFDAAQKQIKTLKDHISFLSNDQCIPIKC